MAVLYRKYRPQKFSQVVGQKHIVQTLKNQAESGSFAHAYLFTGVRGTGKTSVARILAKAANCPKAKGGEPCGTCSVCQQVEQGNFLDLVEIDAASNTGVDNIRELIEHVKFSPSVGSYKIFIVDEVHMLSKGAFNALLKTLEEPPKHAIFILATTEINKVPATIVSRTQRFDFKRLAPEELHKHLQYVVKQEKVSIPEAVFELITRNAEGSARDALSLLDKVLTLGEAAELSEYEQLLGVTDIYLSEQLLGFLVEGGSSSIPEFVERLLEKGTDMAIFNRDFLEYLRKGLIFQASAGKIKISLESQHLEKLEANIKKLTLSEIIFIVRLFLRSFKEMSSSPSPDVPLLLAALEAAERKQTGSAQLNNAPAPSSIKKEQTETKTSQPMPSLTSIVHSELPVFQEVIVEEKELDSVSLAEIRPFWPKIIDLIRKSNEPLAHLVRNSPLREISGGRAILEVKYLFHKQNLENKKNQEIIRAAITEVCGKNLGVIGTVVKEEKAQPVTTAEALSDALQILGGELVE